MNDPTPDLSSRVSQLLDANDARRVTALLARLDQRMAEAERHAGFGDALRLLVKATGRLGRFANPATRLVERVARQLTREQRNFNEATLDALRAMREIVAIKGAEQIADRVEAALAGLREDFAEETDRLRSLEGRLLALGEELEGATGRAKKRPKSPAPRRS